MNRERTVCFTGHRHISPYDRAELTELLRKEIEKQIQEGATVFRTGGAVGFDTLAALTVLECKKRYPHIKLELILPCPTQTEKWKPQDVQVYQTVFQKADLKRYVSPYYFDGLLQMRNRELVNGSDVCIAYLTHSHGGGTAYTSALAIRTGLEYLNLAEQVGWTN